MKQALSSVEVENILYTQSYNVEIERFTNFLIDCPLVINLKLLHKLEDVLENKLTELMSGTRQKPLVGTKEDAKNVSALVRYLPQLCPQCTMKYRLSHDHDYTVIPDQEEISPPLVVTEFRCDHEGCAYRATREEEFRQHLSKHYVHSLTFDTLSINSFEQVNEETNAQSTKPTKIHKCEYCEYKTPHKQLIQRHTARHTGAPVAKRTKKWFVCTQCDYKSLVNRKLRVHMWRVHNVGDAPAATCEICGFVGDPSYIKNLHMRRHLGMKTLFCSICNSGFHSKYHLDRHTRRMHCEMDYKCTLCPFQAKKNTKLAKHMQMNHGGPSPTMKYGKLEIPDRFPCKLCPYKCPRKAHIDRHMRTMHAVEMGLVDEPNLYECDLCGYKSHRKDLVGRHIRKIHKDAGKKLVVSINQDDSFSSTEPDDMTL